MKKTSFFSAACLLVLSATAAQANSVFTDTYTPNGTDGLLLCAQGQGTNCGGGGNAAPDSDSWVFNITNDGFDPATQSISSATIDLVLQDDPNDPGNGNNPPSLEFASLTIGEAVAVDVIIGNSTTEVLSLLTLNADGTLDVTLTATQGDFLFLNATLNAVEDHPAVVPVPAAVWLFGSGLLGLVGIARRRKA